MSIYTDFRTITIPAGADLSALEYCFVKQNNSGQAIVGTAGDDALGVLQGQGAPALPSAAGQNASVAVSGVCLARVGASITTPGPVEIGTGGRVIPLASGVKVGWALSAASENNIIPLVIAG
jgi:hypothetical protein